MTPVPAPLGREANAAATRYAIAVANADWHTDKMIQMTAELEDVRQARDVANDEQNKAHAELLAAISSRPRTPPQPR